VFTLFAILGGFERSLKNEENQDGGTKIAAFWKS